LRFFGHILELRGNDTYNFERLDSVMRRGIRKANNSGLQVEFATSREAIGEFYELHCQTRRRHGVPPQPFRFFENIARHVLGRDLGFVAIARLAGRPVAAAVYFYLQREAIYKFGASDYNQQHWRPNNLLMWEAIKRCVKQGCTRIHLGRTSLGQEGLRRFKLSLGAREEQIAYYRYDFKTQAFVTTVDRAHSRLTNVFRYFPQTLFRAAGRWLYPHLS
jgi:lipid II:glycine glycyltransferase (peptidoglycan interpeptide bridge formation enzyme)